MSSNKYTNTKALQNFAIPPARILLVDDDHDILQLLEYSLAQEGYKIQTTDNGQQALKLLDEFSPDLLCIDYMMPVMDGQELARQIRARQDMLYIPIIMLTAAGNQNLNKISSLNSGVDAYLTKPISREELKVTIRSLLRVKVAQDKMLAALERVSEVQDELLDYERRQGQYEAMQATIATCTVELSTPLKMAEAASNQLARLLANQTETYSSVKQLGEAINQFHQVIDRLNKATHFNTRDGKDAQVFLDLDKN